LLHTLTSEREFWFSYAAKVDAADRDMKLLLDRGTCQGYGNCVIAAPDVFDVDDSGHVVLLIAADGLPDDRTAEIKRAVRECPVAALTFED
jgi:ferredoxin